MNKDKYKIMGACECQAPCMEKKEEVGWKKKIYLIFQVYFFPVQFFKAVVFFFLFFFLLLRTSLRFQIFFKENTLFLQLKTMSISLSYVVVLLGRY